MKTGIIIICYNNEIDIDMDRCVKHLNNVKDVEVCLVNNNSKDNTFHILNKIKEECNNVSVVNIKKFKPEISAVRAGARFMFNQFNLMQLGYIINVNKLDLNSLIKMVCNNQDAILNYNSNTKNDKKIGQTLFQSLFSLSDYLKQLNIKNQFSSLQNQSK
jgi:hypothetical protein